ncbi:MAG: hypothetical protein A2Z25_14465 [Planctomycetes bacterium RBG_16_55_9]|nr:MAG: hypothetical protein A2Z25_14465 [Planctomycetes bacterium RBG_16_55_9]
MTVYTKDCKVLNNTIHDPDSRMGRLVRTVFTNDGLTFANNLLSGPRISNESKSKITFLNNLIKEATNSFADPEHGNLHLIGSQTNIIDKGILLPEMVEDIDREPRGAKIDIGADELIQQDQSAQAF